MTQKAQPAVAGRARQISFWIVTGLASLFLLVVFLPAYPLLFINWLPIDAWLAVRPDRFPGDQVHRLHSLTLGIISWGMLAGFLLQFHRPVRKVAALLMPLAVVVAIACALMLTGLTPAGLAEIAVEALLVLVVCALHPSARAFIRPPRLDRPMLALTVIAAGPWIAYALGMAEAARTDPPFPENEHLMFMVIVAPLIPLWGLIGATDKPGWAFPAGATILATACVALQSLLFSDVLSGLEPLWAWSAVAWCIAYGGAAWLRMRRVHSA